MSSTEHLSKSMTVAVDYRFSLKAFIKATHAAWRSQTIFQALAAMLILLVLSSLLVVVLGAARVQDQFPVLLYTLLAVAFYYVYPAVAFAKDPRHRMAQVLEFSKDAFRYRRGETEATLPWSALKSAVESRQFYVLDLPGRKVAVPKSAFAPGEEQRFRLLAATEGVQIH